MPEDSVAQWLGGVMADWSAWAVVVVVIIIAIGWVSYWFHVPYWRHEFTSKRRNNGKKQ